MKMLMRHMPWCALVLLGCANPFGDSRAGADADGSGGSDTPSAGTAGTAPGSSGAPGAGGGVGAGAPGVGTAGTGGAVDPNVTCGAPPTVSLMSPPAAAELPPAAVALEANMVSTSSSASSVTFYLRPKHDLDFTIAIMPDTQNYVVDPYNQQHFDKQTQWIMDNREIENIVGVIHNGDLINRPEMAFEWDYAEQAMGKLEQPFADYPDGMPYIIAIGNHDQEPMSNTGHADEFNRRFGVERFSGRSYYGGHYGERNDHSYITFQAGSQKFLVLSLEYGWFPAEVYPWALDVIRKHADHRVIIDVHELLDSSGDWSGNGANIYEAFKAEPNVELMTCGHNLGESRRSDTFEGHTIHTMFANWQHLDQGGMGRMRLWRFSPKAGTLLVRTYSPSFDEEFTSDVSRFTLPYDMSQAVPEFAPVAVLGDVAGTVSAMTGELAPGMEYEWYAEATDACGQVTTSEVRSFSTQ